MSLPSTRATVPNMSCDKPRPALRHVGQVGASRSKCSRLTQPPMMTVGAPGGRILPVGLGIGATQDGNDIMSLTRAAGRPPNITVVDPMATIPGAPGMHGGTIHGPVILPSSAAGRFSISTVETQLFRSGNGIGGFAIGVGVGSGGWIGS